MAAAPHHQSLRDRQVASIEAMLKLNQTRPQSSEHRDYHANDFLPDDAIANADDETVWKVLVFDNLGRDVISSVMRVNDLHSCGVTIHLHVDSRRDLIPDVPAVYFVEPTAENLKHITSDLSAKLYTTAYINFLSSVPRPLLEEFATAIAATNTAEYISQVYDQYLNFIVSEPDLFSLGMGKDTYWTMNSSKTTDEELTASVERIVSGLFSVVVTTGSIPIIRCPKGAAAEMVAARLDRKLRDHILNSKDQNLFSGNAQKGGSNATPSSRPVLIIVDRNVDLIPMLSHSWTYQSLAHDALKMNLNQITLRSPATNEETGQQDGPIITKHYDIKPNDFFWNQNAGAPFPDVAGNIDAQLTKYKDDSDALLKGTGAKSLTDLNSNSTNQSIKAAIAQLPEMTERKNILDMHMNIATALFQNIKDRQLDILYEKEQKIMEETKAQIMDFINTSETRPMDKLRILIIWFLSTQQEVTRSDMDKFDESLQKAGADTAALAYIRRVREITRMTMMTSAPTNQPAQPSASANLLSSFGSISSRVTNSFKEAGITADLGKLMSGIKGFMPSNTDLTLTKITESLMDPQNASSAAIARTEDYLYFDPRSANARGTMPPTSVARAGGSHIGGAGRGIEASFGQRRQGFSEAIVFTVGGGSIDEYGNLQEWASRTSGAGGAAAGLPRRRVVYGSTEIINAEDFITAELARLGKEDS